MRVKALYFASLADLMGNNEEILELPDQCDVAGFLEIVEAREPELKKFERRFRVAVNQCFAELTDVIPPNAELAIIPPVSGGGTQGRVSVAIREEPLSCDRALEAVRRTDCGAVVLFLGTVRDLTGEQVTKSLDYTAYREMAEKELQAICLEAVDRFDLGAVIVEHRVGSLDPGEIAVIAAASSVHRDGAFQAARFLIDSTKERVPLWKKEYGPNGVAWIEGDARVPTH